MKRFALIFAILIAGCSFFKGLDQNKAKAVVEALEQKIASGDYAGTAQYYTDEMNQSESPEQRAEKFKRIHDVMGDFQSMECVSAQNATDINDINCVNLVYKVKHTRMTSVEEFTVIDAGTSYKIEVHNIKQQ